jgi:hypothetical protein
LAQVPKLISYFLANVNKVMKRFLLLFCVLLSFLADDAFAQESPAANVGQYEMQDILAQLPVTEAIELSLPLDNPRTLSIPIPVLLEWQSLLFP